MISSRTKRRKGPNARVAPVAATPALPECTTDQIDPGASVAAIEEPAVERITKVALILRLLGREDGATLAELVTATGWLPHTTRAALTGLRKNGHIVEKRKRDDVTCYRVVAAA
jgi:hypothetical protein